MIAHFIPFHLEGTTKAPASKSISHRALLVASLVKDKSVLRNVLLSDDILATIDCLRKMGSDIVIEEDRIEVDGTHFLENVNPVLNCGSSGSTLKFLLPLALLCYKDIEFHGANKLIEGLSSFYENFCLNNNFKYEKHPEYLLINGGLHEGKYIIDDKDENSQYICGLLFALAFHNQESEIEAVNGFTLVDYIDLTIKILNQFGFYVERIENHLYIHQANPHREDYSIEADESNCANLAAFNYIGSNITIENLNENTIQTARVYRQDYELICKDKFEIDMKDCYFLAPVYMCLGALKKGVILKCSSKLESIEKVRLNNMKLELEKIGCEVLINGDYIEVITHPITLSNFKLDGHNDHRIIMALSLILSKYGGYLNNCEGITRNFPEYFEKLKELGGNITME